HSSSFLMTPPPPPSSLFPYTTLFRSHLVARQRHVDVPDAERRQRIDHRVDERRGAADIGALADALRAHQMVRARRDRARRFPVRSEEHTSELQSLTNLVCRLLL